MDTEEIETHIKNLKEIKEELEEEKREKQYERSKQLELQAELEQQGSTAAAETHEQKRQTIDNEIDNLRNQVASLETAIEYLTSNERK
jgi:hypothetical protein